MERLLALGDNHHQGGRSKERRRATARTITYVHVEKFHLSMQEMSLHFVPLCISLSYPEEQSCIPRCLQHVLLKALWYQSVGTAQGTERVSEAHRHQATLNAHWYSECPQLFTIILGSGRAAKISIIICSVPGDQWFQLGLSCIFCGRNLIAITDFSNWLVW